MKKKIGIAVLVAAAVLAVALFLVFRGADKPAQANADEISLQIQLDLKEDIGLLLIDSDMDGAVSSGGSSNADKTMLKKDDCIYWPIERQNDENIPDNVTLSLRFTVVTEYCEPNYENTYPSEYQIPMDAITFPARFGDSYSIRITGDKTNGYQAVLEQG